PDRETGAVVAWLVFVFRSCSSGAPRFTGFRRGLAEAPFPIREARWSRFRREGESVTFTGSRLLIAQRSCGRETQHDEPDEASWCRRTWALPGGGAGVWSGDHGFVHARRVGRL